MKGWASVGHGRPGVKRPQGDKCRGQEAGDTALRTHGGKEGGVNRCSLRTEGRMRRCPKALKGRFSWKREEQSQMPVEMGERSAGRASTGRKTLVTLV